MDHTTENLDHYSASQNENKEQEGYTPRPLMHRIVSWLLIVVVLFAFLGTCYWLAFYRG